MTIRASLLLGLLLGMGSAARAERGMVILGVDGMDPRLLEAFEPDMPNFRKLIAQGGVMELGTSIPPQSPVAWSDFITGLDAGGHGLFDFLALDHQTMFPFQSIARVETTPYSFFGWELPTRKLEIGERCIPLEKQATVLNRKGTAFWEILEDHGVDTTIFMVPANYPPVEAGGRSISGMGTPDLRGTPGTFSFFTDAEEPKAGPVSGGVIHQVRVVDGVVRGYLEGPPDACGRRDHPRARTEFHVYVDPEHPVAEVRIGSSRALLREGEWSQWLRFDMELIPDVASASGMARFFLKQLRPTFRLYASPVNIDPSAPAQAISTPQDYSAELVETAELFYTQEMPEDTKALSAHVLTPEEFMTQSGLVMQERERLLRHELARYREVQGRRFLFFYLSSIDQRGHMLYRQMDPEHPFHESDTSPELKNAMRRTYVEVDRLLGLILEAIDESSTLLVMSDHGFSSFRRQANLNTWLERQGYLVLEDPGRRDEAQWLQGLDWSRTRAFAIGLNSLYLNVRGRDRHGIVEPAERATLAREIADKLLTWKDPENGLPVVTQPLVREDAYQAGPYLEEAPDILVGYADGYRSSWGTTSAKVPEALLEDNDREWSGDHCMDARVVPGVLVSNRALEVDSANLRDLPVTILSEFGIEPPEQMRGRSVF